MGSGKADTHDTRTQSMIDASIQSAVANALAEQMDIHVEEMRQIKADARQFTDELRAENAKTAENAQVMVDVEREKCRRAMEIATNAMLVTGGMKLDPESTPNKDEEC